MGFAQTTYNEYQNYCSFSVLIMLMQQNSQASLPACSEHHLEVNGNQITLQSSVQMEPTLLTLPPDDNCAPIIQNHYSFQQDGILVKATIIKIGNQVFRLTDRITVKKEGNNSDDSKTKQGENSQQETRRDLKKRKLSRACRNITKMFQDWIRVNHPHDLPYIKQIRQCQTQKQRIELLSQKFGYQQIHRQLRQQKKARRQKKQKVTSQHKQKEDGID